MRLLAFGPRRFRLVGGSGLLLLLTAVLGCGGPKEAKVSGQVKYEGAPLPGGTITFRPTDPTKNSVVAQIDESGHYSATLPVGEIKICIDNRELEPPPPVSGAPAISIPGLPAEVTKAMRAKAPKAESKGRSDRPGRYVRIPTRYHEIETSGLSYTVKAGDQTHDIELTK